MGNREKSALLGMPFGTASNRLRKAILFRLVQRLNEDKCFRCGKSIVSVDDLSIEHKESWQSAYDPVEAFFSLDNISFSHLSCNIAAGSGGAVHADMTRLSPEGHKAGRKRRYEEVKNTDAYKKRNRDYQRNRYNNDSEFRTYHINKSKKYRNAPLVE